MKRPDLGRFHEETETGFQSVSFFSRGGLPSAIEAGAGLCPAGGPTNEKDGGGSVREGGSSTV
jgi:hypothetical protein